MTDLLDCFSNPSTTKTAIAQQSVNSNEAKSASTTAPTTKTAMPRAVRGATIAPGSTNPYLVYLSQLGVGSRRTMRGSLEHIAQMVSGGDLDAINFPWSSLRYQHTQAIYTHLLETRAPATANKMIAALGRVLKEAWKLGQMSAEDYHRAVAIERRTGQRQIKGRALSALEVGAILNVCCQDLSVKGCRDAALIAVLYGAGVRRAEVVALELEDWNSVDYCLSVRRGKGDKDRTTYLDHGASQALLAWLAVRGEHKGTIFHPLRKGGKIEMRSLSDQAVLDIIHERGKQAQVADFSPHDFRRTFISNLLDAGADISTVQKLAGHASPVTTARYDRRGEVAKRKAVGLLHTPYSNVVGQNKDDN